MLFFLFWIFTKDHNGEDTPLPIPPPPSSTPALSTPKEKKKQHETRDSCWNSKHHNLISTLRWASPHSCFFSWEGGIYTAFLQLSARLKLNPTYSPVQLESKVEKVTRANRRQCSGTDNCCTWNQGFLQPIPSFSIYSCTMTLFNEV